MTRAFDIAPRVNNADASQCGGQGSECLADPTLERLLTGGCGESERAVWEAHLEICAPCAHRLEELAGPCPDRIRAPQFVPTPLKSPLLQMLISVAGRPPGDAFGAEPTDTTPRECGLAFVPPGFSNPLFLGRGGSGLVYRARQCALNRDVALKVLGVDHNPRAALRAQHEAQMVAMLSHPHVITIHEAQLLQTPPYLVMEWIAGGSLQDRLRAGPLSVADATILGWQVAQGVSACHALGIIHRDLKPANVLLASRTKSGSTHDDPFCAKITDFGLARAVDAASQGSQDGGAVGTPAYMSPEQTGLRPELGPPGQASDIHGVGAVLFAALAGQPPHTGDTPLATMMHVAWEDAPWLPGLRPEVPLDLALIVSKCLCTHPDERYRTIRELLDDLRRFREGQPIAARHYTPRERLRNWTRRHPTGTATLALGAAVVLAGLLGVGYHVVRLRASLAELAQERVRTHEALDSANRAVEAEQSQRRRAIRQANVTHQLSSLPFTGKVAPTAEDFARMDAIREFYLEQVHNPEQLSQELREVIGDGVLNCSQWELRFFNRPKHVLQDTQLVLGLLGRAPQSSSLRVIRGRALQNRFQALLVLKREADASELLPDLVQTLRDYEITTDLAQLDHLLNCVVTLWNAGRLDVAVDLIRHALAGDPNVGDGAPLSPDLWPALLSLQGSEVGLLHQLQRLNEAGDALWRWRTLADRFQLQQPGKQPIMTIQWLRLIVQHLHHGVEEQTPEATAAWLQEGILACSRIQAESTRSTEGSMALLEWATTLLKLDSEHIDPVLVQSLAGEILQWSQPVPAQGGSDSLRLIRSRVGLGLATIALETGRFAEALQAARGVLSVLCEQPSELKPNVDSPAAQACDLAIQQACELAAEACRKLDQPAEELAHLSHAVSLAKGDDRTRLEARVQQRLQSLTGTAESLRKTNEEPWKGR